MHPDSFSRGVEKSLRRKRIQKFTLYLNTDVTQVKQIQPNDAADVEREREGEGEGERDLQRETINIGSSARRNAEGGRWD